MQVKILGCSGGIGGHLRTTSLLVDDDILIDAGTGVGDLSFTQLLAIDHIFISHAHLDHIAMMPLLIDTVIGVREAPVTVHATQDTIAILQQHIFNGEIWPDFNKILHLGQPFLRYSEIHVGEPLEIKGRQFTPLPANHTVPAVGFHLASNEASLVYTGDTSHCDALWQAIGQITHLKFLIIETAFSNKEQQLAHLSKHFCSSTLVEALAQLVHTAHAPTARPAVYITHLKPGEEQEIMHEITSSNLPFTVAALEQQQCFYL